MPDPIKEVFDLYAAYGGKGDNPKFESRDFAKFCKDAGLIVEKQNKFNMCDSRPRKNTRHLHACTHTCCCLFIQSSNPLTTPSSNANVVAICYAGNHPIVWILSSPMLAQMVRVARRETR